MSETTPFVPRKKTVLTGVKPTGEPHLGNYLGAIRPALRLANTPEFESFLFIADYHALTTLPSAKELRDSSHCVTATWLACGLDPKSAVIYRQSDVPETFELNWILACMAPKGLANRAHAYKAAMQSNEEKGEQDVDAGVNVGLFTYPILMAADILICDSEIVPVGPDQVQHVEICRDLAQKLNREYGKCLKIPNFQVQEVGLIPGLDGRKMSKSYDNGIPMFADSAQIRKLVMRVKTDSLPPEAPKNTEDSILFSLYKEFATPEQTAALAKRYAEGVGWGEVKELFYGELEAYLKPKRERYLALRSEPEKLDQILKEGAEKARTRAQRVIKRVRTALGVDLPVSR